MEKTGGKFLLQCDTHSRHTSRGLCMLMERQCMVDIAICCGSNTLHAHKCILAVHSPYFKEHLDNKAIEQVVINGLDFAVIKAIVEFMYCGECVVGEDHFKHFIAAVKLFKIGALETILGENEYQNLTADEISIPNPQFICKPPKYPTVYKPYSNSTPLSPKLNYALSPAYNAHKFKRKCFGSEAEKACAKEAQASRIALANLRKVMASTPQVHSFIVEESFNETTVENFIPSAAEESFETLGEVAFEPPAPAAAEPPKLAQAAGGAAAPGLTADRIKRILGNEDVEIMFQTSDGNFVNVSDEVLLNLSKNGLQYQVVDENGHVGELQELKTLVTEAATSGGAEAARGVVAATLTATAGGRAILKAGIEGFDLKMLKAGEEIDKMTKAITEEYIDKTNLDPLPSFGDNLYENGFHTNEIFEPENLSMHPDFMVDNGFVDSVNKYLTPKLNVVKNDLGLGAGNAVKDGAENEVGVKSMLKFNADMFFADLSGSKKETSTDVVIL